MADQLRDNDAEIRPAPEDTIAQTGPGIPDDAAGAGYDPVADVELEHELDQHLPTAETLFKPV